MVCSRLYEVQNLSLEAGPPNLAVEDIHNTKMGRAPLNCGKGFFHLRNGCLFVQSSAVA